VEVWFKYLYLHVVDVVFNELEHSMSKSVGLLKCGLDIALFGALVLLPHILEVLAHVFAL
jgi:hypothetical protein